jgi:hypothetical protein
MATRYNYTGGIVTDGLVLHLDAAKRDSYPGSGTTWYDLSGVTENATLLNNPTFTSSGKATAFDYDATNDGTAVYGVPNFNQEVSVEAWVKPEGDPEGNGGAGTIYTQGGLYLQYRFDGTFANFFREGYYFTPAVITYGNWYNVVQVWDKANFELKVYVNGILELTTTLINNAGNPASTTGYIGMQGTDPDGSYSRKFNGKISVIKLYEKVLTASEIQQNYNALKGRYGL